MASILAGWGGPLTCVGYWLVDHVSYRNGRIRLYTRSILIIKTLRYIAPSSIL